MPKQRESWRLPPNRTVRRTYLATAKPGRDFGRDRFGNLATHVPDRDRFGNLTRATKPAGSADAPGVQLDTAGKVLSGYAIRWDEWTTIGPSRTEGLFRERFQAGAFTDTLRTGRVVSMLEHGHDHVGQRPLGVLQAHEDRTGLAYSVRLFEGVGWIADLLPSFRAGLYGASIRFGVRAEDIDTRPPRSDGNPDQIPERTVTVASLTEVSAVLFPAYKNATANLTEKDAA